MGEVKSYGPRKRRKTQGEVVEAGFMAVAQSNVQVVHRTDGPCWDDDEPHYIPFRTVEKGIAHGNLACTKCCGDITEPAPVMEDSSIKSPEETE